MISHRISYDIYKIYSRVHICIYLFYDVISSLFSLQRKENGLSFIFFHHVALLFRLFLHIRLQAKHDISIVIRATNLCVSLHAVHQFTS